MQSGASQGTGQLEDHPAEGDDGVPPLVRRLAPAVPVAGCLVLMAWAVITGMSVLHLLTAILAVAATQVLPGAVIWRLVRPRDGWWVEDLTMGFAVGSVLALLAQIPAGLLGLPWFSAVVVLGVAGLLMALPQTRRRVLEARTTPLPWWWGPALTPAFFVTVAQLRSYLNEHPLSWGDGAVAPHVDTYLHLALSGQLAHRGPTTFPWVQSEELGYHWFSHAWVAQVAQTSGAGLDEVLMRFMPLLVPVVVSLAVAVAAVRLTGRAWTGPAAALATMMFGGINAFGRMTHALPVTPLSPSLGISVPMLLGIVVLLVVRWRDEARSGAWVVLMLLAIGATGTKGSTTPLIFAGLGLAGAAMLVFNRRMVLRIVVDGLLIAAALVPVFVLVFRGSGAGLHISIKDAASQAWPASLVGVGSSSALLLDAIILIFCLLMPAFLCAVALLDRRWRAEPAIWLLLGGGIAGAMARVVFAHPGHSQGYFTLSAMPLLALAAICGLALVEGRREPRDVGLALGAAVAGPVAMAAPAIMFAPVEPGDDKRIVVVFLLGALGLLAVGLVGWFGAGRDRLVTASAVVGIAALSAAFVVNFDGIRRPVPPVPTVTAESLGALTDDQLDAARWIRDHSDPDDVVMTNRHCRDVHEDPTDGCDNRWWVVAALSERQALVEGWTATPRSAEEGPEGRDSIVVAYWDQELLELNDGFIAEPSEEAAEALRDRGVRWVYVDHGRPHADTLEPFAQRRFEADGVEVYELE